MIKNFLQSNNSYLSCIPGYNSWNILIPVRIYSNNCDSHRNILGYPKPFQFCPCDHLISITKLSCNFYLKKIKSPNCIMSNQFLIRNLMSGLSIYKVNCNNGKIHGTNYMIKYIYILFSPKIKLCIYVFYFFLNQTYYIVAC